MEDILLQQSEWESYVAAPASLQKLMKEKFPTCSFVPSAEMLGAIKEEYSNSVIQVCMNGEGYTAYRVHVSENDELHTFIVELNDEDDEPIFFDSEQEYMDSLKEE